MSFFFQNLTFIITFTLFWGHSSLMCCTSQTNDKARKKHPTHPQTVRGCVIIVTSSFSVFILLLLIR